MNYSKTIVCLANSRKPGGRCVAGKEVSEGRYGPWIRPVSVRASAEIARDERQYENGREPEILDVINIPMIAAVPRVHQTENHMIDADCYWSKTGALAWDDVEDLLDRPPKLWGASDSTHHGRHDRITPADASRFRNSLWLITPEDVVIGVLTPGADFGNPKRAVRADFRYQGTRYNFKVTDIIAEQAFLARPNGDYALDQEVKFCISLAEAHTDGYCYKLVATVISEQPL